MKEIAEHSMNCYKKIVQTYGENRQQGDKESGDGEQGDGGNR